MSKTMPVVYRGVIFPSVLALFKHFGKGKKEYDRFLKWKDRNFLTAGYYSINDYVRQWLDEEEKKWIYHGKSYDKFKDIFADINMLDKAESCRSWISYHKDELENATTEEKIDAYLRMLSKKSH